MTVKTQEPLSEQIQRIVNEQTAKLDRRIDSKMESQTIVIDKLKHDHNKSLQQIHAIERTFNNLKLKRRIKRNDRNLKHTQTRVYGIEQEIKIVKGIIDGLKRDLHGLYADAGFVEIDDDLHDSDGEYEPVLSNDDSETGSDTNRTDDSDEDHMELTEGALRATQDAPSSNTRHRSVKF